MRYAVAKILLRWVVIPRYYHCWERQRPERRGEMIPSLASFLGFFREPCPHLLRHSVAIALLERGMPLDQKRRDLRMRWLAAVSDKERWATPPGCCLEIAASRCRATLSENPS